MFVGNVPIRCCCMMTLLMGTMCWRYSRAFYVAKTMLPIPRMVTPSLSMRTPLRPLHQSIKKDEELSSLSLSLSSSSTTTCKNDSYREQKVHLPSGVDMQILSALPSFNADDQNDSNKKMNKPPILFLHGSFHGAWCWTEHYFPYFTSQGYPVVALSWRGTGGTYAGDGVKKVPIADHVLDLKCIIDMLPQLLNYSEQDSTSMPRPIVVAHSFGGLAVMKALEEEHEQQQRQPQEQEQHDEGASTVSLASPFLAAEKLGGIAMMCVVPPSGNGKMTMRFLRRSLIDSYKITVGFAMKRCLTNEQLCRELFFGNATIMDHRQGTGEEVSDDDLKRYQSYFVRDSKATIDLLDLSKQLPSKKTDADGRAFFVDRLPPCLVLGATRDFIVDREGVEETAQYFGLEQPILVDSPHDVMLGSNWEHAAKELNQWIETIIVE